MENIENTENLENNEENNPLFVKMKSKVHQTNFINKFNSLRVFLRRISNSRLQK